MGVRVLGANTLNGTLGGQGVKGEWETWGNHKGHGQVSENMDN